jgi:intracellular sulfur oxidation DsrE/DsrF family protein
MANAYSVIGKVETMSDYKIEIKNLYKIFGPNDKSMVDLVANGIGKQDLLDQQKCQHWHLCKLNQCHNGAFWVWKINSDTPHQ